MKVLALAFHSRQDTKTPVKAGVAVVANIIATVLLLAALLFLTDIGRPRCRGWRRHPCGIESARAHACLALAPAVAGGASMLQVWGSLRRAGVFGSAPGWGRFLRQLAVASLAMTAVVVSLLWAWDGWTAWHWSERAWKLAVVVGIGGLV